MGSLSTFIMGFLAGWFIAFLYWRRRDTDRGVVYAPDAPLVSRTASGGEIEPPIVDTTRREDLKLIRGIGPVIERKLNEAGVFTFEQLGNLTTADLESILGSTVKRLADEGSLLQQARDLTRRKS
jgi:predicted flap endonuclease-1-like 5' DNA nuclease